jgi:hypothetical protein
MTTTGGMMGTVAVELDWLKNEWVDKSSHSISTSNY